jgi:hypothetical protein
MATEIRIMKCGGGRGRSGRVSEESGEAKLNVSKEMLSSRYYLLYTVLFVQTNAHTY